MSETEHQAAIDEVIGMAHNEFVRRPHKRGYIICEEDAVLYATAKQQVDALIQERNASAKAVVDLQEKINDYETAELKQRIIHSIIPIAVALTWVIGAAEGLADPVFTAVTTGTCVLWAVVSYKWGNTNA